MTLSCADFPYPFDLSQERHAAAQLPLRGWRARALHSQPELTCEGAELVHTALAISPSGRCGRWQGWIQVGLLQKNPANLQAPTADPLHEKDGFSVEECDLLKGDEADKVVTWQGREDISSLGESLVIRVRLSRAKLFAYLV